MAANAIDACELTDSLNQMMSGIDLQWPTPV